MSPAGGSGSDGSGCAAAGCGMACNPAMSMAAMGMMNPMMAMMNPMMNPMMGMMNPMMNPMMGMMGAMMGAGMAQKAKKKPKVEPPAPKPEETQESHSAHVAAFNPEELQKRLLLAQSEALADQSRSRRKSRDYDDDEERPGKRHRHDDDEDRDVNQESPHLDHQHESDSHPPPPDYSQPPPPSTQSWPGPPPRTDRMDPRMQETLQKMNVLEGTDSSEARARRMDDARKAAEDIKVSLDMKGNLSPEERQQLEQQEKPKTSGVSMGVVVHWTGARGFGILRSQAHGEVFVHAKSLVNATDLVVGDVVTFELGFDTKKSKPEALNVCKAGVGGYKAPPSVAGGRDDGFQNVPTFPAGGETPAAPVISQTTNTASAEADTSSTKKPANDALLAGAATAAAMKLLSQGMGASKAGSGGSKKKKKDRSSSSSSSRRRRRKSRSRSRSRGRRRR